MRAAPLDLNCVPCARRTSQADAADIDHAELKKRETWINSNGSGKLGTLEERGIAFDDFGNLPYTASGSWRQRVLIISLYVNINLILMHVCSVCSLYLWRNR